MFDDVDVNVGAVIFLAMKKARLHSDSRYGFEGLLTKFLWDQGVDEEDLDYRLPVITSPVDVSRTKGDPAYGAALNLLEHQAQNVEIAAWMYGLQML